MHIGQLRYVQDMTIIVIRFVNNLFFIYCRMFYEEFVSLIYSTFFWSKKYFIHELFGKNILYIILYRIL
jgi:hypothetical protein